MTTEERLDRIEHLTAGIAEERRRDREESKALWRDTQRQLDEAARTTVSLATTVAELGIRIRDLAEESRAADRRLSDRIDALGDRIGSLVSALGEHLRQGHP